MDQSKSNKHIPKPEKLAARFFSEILAAAAGVTLGKLSMRELGELAADKRHCDIHDAVVFYFKSLMPYRRFGDFQGLATLPRPRPLQLHVEPHILHGHFHAWLRRKGINPDTVDVGIASWRQIPNEETEP